MGLVWRPISLHLVVLVAMGISQALAHPLFYAPTEWSIDTVQETPDLLRELIHRRGNSSGPMYSDSHMRLLYGVVQVLRSDCNFVARTRCCSSSSSGGHNNPLGHPCSLWGSWVVASPLPVPVQNWQALQYAIRDFIPRQCWNESEYSRMEAEMRCADLSNTYTHVIVRPQDTLSTTQSCSALFPKRLSITLREESGMCTVTTKSYWGNDQDASSANAKRDVWWVRMPDGEMRPLADDYMVEQVHVVQQLMTSRGGSEGGFQFEWVPPSSLTGRSVSCPSVWRTVTAVPSDMRDWPLACGQLWCRDTAPALWGDHTTWCVRKLRQDNSSNHSSVPLHTLEPVVDQDRTTRALLDTMSQWVVSLIVLVAMMTYITMLDGAAWSRHPAVFSAMTVLQSLWPLLLWRYVDVRAWIPTFIMVLLSAFAPVRYRAMWGARTRGPKYQMPRHTNWTRHGNVYAVSSCILLLIMWACVNTGSL
jgi:hypothetical protein